MQEHKRKNLYFQNTGFTYSFNNELTLHQTISSLLFHIHSTFTPHFPNLRPRGGRAVVAISTKQVFPSIICVLWMALVLLNGFRYRVYFRSTTGGVSHGSFLSHVGFSIGHYTPSYACVIFI